MLPSLAGVPVSVPWSQLGGAPTSLPGARADGSLNAGLNGNASVAGRSVGAAGGSSSTIAATSVGKVSAFSGNSLTLMLPNGTTKSFAVSAAGFGAALPRVGDRLAVSTDAAGNVVSIAAADQSLRATVTRITKNGVVLALANGRTIAVNLASKIVSKLKLKDGSAVDIATHDGGRTSTLIAAK